jgi:hypothetical protein
MILHHCIKVKSENIDGNNGVVIPLKLDPGHPLSKNMKTNNEPE